MAIRNSYVDIDAGQIHLRSIAGTGTPVIFFHQAASSGLMWVKVMTRLAGRWPLHAFDLPGFGGSFDPPKETRPTMTEYVAWLHQAVLAAGIERAHIVGHHTGACIGVELAVRHPDLVQSLTMIGPVPLTADERIEFSKHFGLPFTPTASGAYLLENWDYLRALGAHRDPLLINREMSDQLRAWWGRVQSYSAVWGQDFPHYYSQVKCPMLIGAAPDDVLRPYLDRAREMRPDAEVLDIDGANYEPDLDPDTFATGLASFLERHG